MNTNVHLILCLQVVFCGLNYVDHKQTLNPFLVKCGFVDRILQGFCWIVPKKLSMLGISYVFLCVTTSKILLKFQKLQKFINATI